MADAQSSAQTDAQADTQANTGADQNTNIDATAQETAPTAAVEPRPWYVSPWFWGILLFVAVLALLAWLFWLQWQAHALRLSQEEVLLAAQEEKNTSLEAEIARLQALLAEEPCTIKEQVQGLVLPFAPQENIPPSVVQQQQQPIAPKVEDTSPKQNTAPQSSAEAPPPPPLASTENTENNDTAQEAQAAPSTTEKVQSLESATVLILSQEPSGLQMGTGFFIAPGIVLTNQHVVGSGKAPIYVVGTFKGTATKAKVLAISPNSKRDYAVLQVPITSVTPLALTTQVQRTEKVSTWGFPSAVTTNDPKFKNLMDGSDTKAPDVIYSEGTVSVIQEQDPSLIVHTAIVSQGNSGGPLVNEQGHVVGINTYIHMDKQSYRQSSLSIVASDIIAFLQEHNIPYTLAAGNKE